MNYKEIKKMVVKGLNILLISVTVFMIIFTVLSINVNKDSNNGLLGRKLFIVLSDSMKPKFQAGDIVITKTIDPDKLKEGDIITFYVTNGTVVTHQIQERTVIDSKNAFVTKGINVDQVDEKPVYESSIIGKYSYSIPKAGHLINFLKTTAGFITLILIPLLFIISINTYQFIKEIKLYYKDKLVKINENNAQLENERLKNEKMSEELKRLKDQIGIIGDNGESN